jgi:hypothetical protein
MITSLDIQYIKYDIVQYSTILLLVSIINNYFKDTEFFNEEWNSIALITLIAVIISDLFITKLIKYINTHIANTIIQDSISDFFKFGTIFLFSQIIKNYFINKSINLTKDNFLVFIFTLLGFLVFNIIYPSLPTMEYKKQIIFDDMLKLSLGVICVGIFVDKKFDEKHLIELLIIFIGVTMFHYGTKNILSSDTIAEIEKVYPNKVVLSPSLLDF